MSDEGAKNFEFPNMVAQWIGYNSANDPTNLAPNIYVRGSQNMYKKLSGTLAVRQGQKRVGSADSTASPVSSEFVWNTSWGQTYLLWISNSKLQVLIDNVFYTLLDSLTQTRYVFDKWWDDTEKKDRALFVKGDSDIQSWSGGVANIDSGTAPVSGAVTSGVIAAGGTSYVTGDVVTVTGGGGSGATFSVTATAGVVTGLTELTAGTGYSDTTGASTTGGSGTSLTITITTGVAGTLTKQGTDSWADAGFATNLANEKKIMIAGTEYTYVSGEEGLTLFGVTPDPSGILAGTIALQSVVTVTDHPAPGFKNDFIKVVNNRLYVGSYVSRLIYISASDDYTDFAIVSPPTPVGSPNLLTLDSTGKGIGIKDGNPYIGYGTSEWMSVTYPTFTDSNGALYEQITPNIFPVAKLAAPLAHEFIGLSGNNIIYLAQDQQVRELGDFNQSFVAAFPSLSQEIATELMEENFTGGGLKCIGDFTYITAPVSGKSYLYQVRQSVNPNNQVVVERLWHSPFIWNATRVDELNGEVVVFSNANPQFYEVWDTGQWHDDSPSDEPLPYSCVLALSYRQPMQSSGGYVFARRQGLQSFDKAFSEGYITEGTPLYLTVNYDWQGVTGNPTFIVNSIAQPAHIFNPAVGSLGDTSLGDKPLGDEIGDTNTDDMPKFKVINSVSQLNCFEYQPIYSSDTVDANWELLAQATNATIEANQNATFIINKLKDTSTAGDFLLLENNGKILQQDNSFIKL